MNTPEKIQVVALFAIFSFLSYITAYTIRQTLEMQSRPPRVFLPKAKVQQPVEEKVEPTPEKATKKAPEKKGVKLTQQRSQELFTRGQRKATSGDCDGAIKDLDAAAKLDSSLKDQIPSALDACKQK